MLQHLPTMQKALASIPNTKEIKDFKFQASNLDSTFTTQQDLCDL